MNKTEMIFLIIIILLYSACSIFLKIPLIIQLIFAAVILASLFIIMLFKFREKDENKKISRILQILSLITLILSIISIISESYFKKIFIADSGIFMLIFLLIFLISWFFEKKEY